LNCKVLGAELINRIYGITNLENEYGIVTNLYPCGNLRTVLPDVCFFDIIRILSHISAALHKIHENNYAHGNLHSRNILMRKNSLDHYEAVIGDFRLSKSLSPGAVGRKARAADIYAFGLIMSEIITIPSNQLRMYRAVLKQCRDAKPAELPTAKDLSLLFHYWYLFLLDGEDAEMHKNKLLKILTNVILFGR
jgi:serine/threonine protein kinase